MTSRERLVAVARGGSIDRAPIILLGEWNDQADACAVSITELKTDSSAACLARVASPFGKAISRGIDLNQLLYDDPERGNAVLDELVSETAAEMATALDRGADGICYHLEGAYPAMATPMQYGGYYLERDRELLEQVRDARFNLVFIEGREEVYLDSVSDLPADALGWHVAETGFSLDQMRELRQGAFASFGDEADIRLATTSAELLDALRRVESAEVSA